MSFPVDLTVTMTGVTRYQLSHWRKTGLLVPEVSALAALIAVVAAGIAYAGVTKTTRTTRLEKRRDEKAVVLTEASAAIQELTRALDRVGLTEDAKVRAERVAQMDAGPMKKLGDRSAMAATKLALYGFDGAAEQAETLNDTLRVPWDNLRNDPAAVVNLKDCHLAYDRTQREIHTALRGLLD